MFTENAIEEKKKVSRDQKKKTYWERQEELGQKAAARIPMVEIWQADSNALTAMISAICTYENRRAWFEIVARWLTVTGTVMIDDTSTPTEEQLIARREFQEKLKGDLS